jgi:diguanylate cyclase (GGDEF)-like protein/putative nucleotidyltransferase with HDIG domain
LWARLYIALTVLLGMGILTVALQDWRPRNVFYFAVYLGFAVAASSLRIMLPGITAAMSVDYLFILIGVAMLDLPENLMLGMACTLTRCLWRGKQRAKPIHVVFNLPSSAIAVASAYAVYHSGWLRGVDDSAPTLLLAASTAYFLANTFSIAGIVSLTERKRPWTVWHESFLGTMPQHLVGAGLAIVITLCAEQIGRRWPLAVMPAVYLIYSSYRLYFERLQEEKQQVSQAADLHLRTIEALAVAIEAKDVATRAHLQRVQVYALEIAKELGAPESEMQALRAASLLHDIGKLAVPDYILSKPGRLTPEEFDRVKIHPEVGAEILRRVQFPYPVAPIVEAHHERWDGTGYPHGLQGEQIPLGARILSVVDCLDALTSDRQYRRALPPGEALGFIVSQSGSSFDPKVVEVLKRRYPELEEQCRAAAVPDKGLPANVHASRATAPQAGFEATRSNDRGEARNFTFAIAAARQEFQMLHEVTSELGNSLSMEGTLSLLGTRLRAIVPHSAIAIYVRREQNLVPHYLHGKDIQLLSSVEIPIGQGLSGWVAENRKAIVNGNPSVEPGYVQNGAQSGGLHSALSVPLLGVSGVVGVLTLYHAEPDAFTKDHLRLLLAISSKAALTIENALKYRAAQKSAVTDELTGLPNARALFLHLDSEVARCTRTKTPLGVLVADLDGFKLVNDRFGHLAGNQVLRTLGRGLQQACRPYDYVARMGGDEFVLILPGMKPSAVKQKVRELCAMAVGAGREATGEEILSLSVGAAFFPEDALETEELLAAADRRMYQVKQSHRTAQTQAEGEIDLRELAMEIVSAG